MPGADNPGEDLPALAKHLLEKACRKVGRPAAAFSPDARLALTSSPWPSHARELENTIERAVLLADGLVATPDLLALELPEVSGGQAAVTTEAQDTEERAESGSPGSME